MCFLQTHVDLSHMCQGLEHDSSMNLKNLKVRVCLCNFSWHERLCGPSETWQFKPGGRVNQAGGGGREAGVGFFLGMGSCHGHALGLMPKWSLMGQRLRT